MYVRPPQSYRYQNPLRVPENYGGSTFREVGSETRQRDSEAKKEPPIDEAATQQSEASEKTELACANAKDERLSLLRPPFRLRLPSIFGKEGGIGSEELLILALILLLADSDEGFDDLVLFLVLLFFVR